MKTTVKKVLKSWRVSLEQQGVINTASIDKGIKVLSEYLKDRDDTKAIRKMVREVRNDIAANVLSGERLMRKIQRIFALLEKVDQCAKRPMVCMMAQKTTGRPKLEGQEARFKGETQRIFEERLRFKGGMPLRTFDIDIESACDSRKVRRIIEKRMCQAYRKMNKRSGEMSKSNADRYWMKRATSFQLYNIGQIEDVKHFSRGLSTHWKKMFDPQTGKVVYKKKMSYPTYEAACAAIEKWVIEHPYDKGRMQAYQCSICQKWHIGHKSALAEAAYEMNDNVFEVVDDIEIAG